MCVIPSESPAPLQTVPLSAEAVPPPESPPTPEIPPNTPAPTLTPTLAPTPAPTLTQTPAPPLAPVLVPTLAPTLISTPTPTPTQKPAPTPAPTLTPTPAPTAPAQVTKPPAKTPTKHDFEDLIAVLVELSASGSSRPRFGTVSRLLKDRKPDAFELVGVTQFKSYLQLAESVEVVTVEHLPQGGDGWITLRHQRNTNSNSPSLPAPSQQAKSRFRDLIKVLNDLRIAEDPEPKFRAVARQLGKIPSVYENAKVTRFKEYVEAAVEAGVVTVRGVRNGDGWFKLSPAYCNLPVHSSTSSGSSNIPSTRASTTSSFAPLVNLLKSSASAQPTPFSDVFAHLISTHGYPGLVSLYTSVPGVTTFGQYIDAAIAAGSISLVSGTTASRDALISLRDMKSTSPQPGASTTPLPFLPSSQGTTVSPSSTNAIPNSFRDLAAVLTELRASTGESEFRVSNVVPLLLKRKPNVYASAGVAKFTDYIVLAVEKGVVRARGMKQGDGWVSLCDPRPGELQSASGVSQSDKS